MLAARPAVIVIEVGPPIVGAALTITVTSNRAVPPCESVTVIVSRYVLAGTFAATFTKAKPDAAPVVSKVMPALVATEAACIVKVFPEAPLDAITFNCAAAPLEVVRVDTPPSPAKVIPGLTVKVTKILDVAPNESVAVIVS